QNEEHARADGSAQNLRSEVARKILPRETSRCTEPQGDRRIEMASRYVSEAVRAAEHGQPEGERNAEQPYSDAGERGGEDRAAASAEDQDECSYELRDHLSHANVLPWHRLISGMRREAFERMRWRRSCPSFGRRSRSPEIAAVTGR